MKSPVLIYDEKRHHVRTYRFYPLREGITVGFCIFLVFFLLIYFIYHHARAAQTGEIREGLLRTARVVATLIDGDRHRQFTSREQEESKAYKDALAPLARALAADKSIEFIYTTIYKGGKIYFILDPTEAGDADGDGVDDKSHIMEYYNDAGEDIARALTEQVSTASKEPYKDKWGTHFSYYVPFYDNVGEFVGVLGIDITAAQYFQRLEPIKRATQRALAAAVFISFLVGTAIWFLRRFSRLINQSRLRIANDFKMSVAKEE